jgi:hypothetical protein
MDLLDELGAADALGAAVGEIEDSLDEREWAQQLKALQAAEAEAQQAAAAARQAEQAAAAAVREAEQQR